MDGDFWSFPFSTIIVEMKRAPFCLTNKILIYFCVMNSAHSFPVQQLLPLLLKRPNSL